jgi:hypothetical protein
MTITATGSTIIFGDSTVQSTAISNTTAAIDASQIVTGTLPIARGGTNSTSTPTSGGVAYGTGSAIGITAAGSSGQVLTSAGTSVPSWTTPTPGSMVLISSVNSTSGIQNFAFTSGISGTYTKYRIITEGIYSLGGTAQAALNLLFYTSSGNYDTNNVYNNIGVWNSGNLSGTATVFGTSPNSQPSVVLGPGNGGMAGNNAQNGYNTIIDLSTYYNTSGNYFASMIFNGSGGQSFSWTGQAFYKGTSGNNQSIIGFKIYFPSGATDLVGKVSLYGIT